jgi:hypothetical protein
LIRSGRLLRFCRFRCVRLGGGCGPADLRHAAVGIRLVRTMGGQIVGDDCFQIGAEVIGILAVLRKDDIAVPAGAHIIVADDAIGLVRIKRHELRAFLHHDGDYAATGRL